MDGILALITIFLIAAVVAVPIATRLGLGSVLGYLLAGVVIGPVMGLVGSHETQTLQHVAEYGVVMMLFIIGLELDPRALWAMRTRLLGLGGLQIGLTMGAVALGAIWMGEAWQMALAIGMMFALSSTAIVLQTLSEKGLMQTSGGRATFSVLLAQDIAVIPMLALVPLLATLPHGAEDAAHGAATTWIDTLPAWGVALATLGAVGFVIVAGIVLPRPLFRYIHAAHMREMYTALALLIVVGIAGLMALVGLSPALGTFLAGVVLANSEFRHELESDIQPFKGLLLGLFFITVGAGIDLDLLMASPGAILMITLGLIALKASILFLLGRGFGLRGRSLWLFCFGLAQAGEFGFVLISVTLTQGVLPRDIADSLLLVIALSMLITPLLFILFEQLTKLHRDTNAPQHDDEIDESGPVIIAGIGRFGQIVNRLVRSTGLKTVVLDHDMGTIDLMRRFGVKGFLGDPTRPDLLHAAGLEKARVLVVAMDSQDAATRLVAYARRERPDLHIIARARDRHHVFELYQAGADDIVREMFDASLRAGRYVLENTGMSDYEANLAEKTFYQHDRHTVRELAKLWDPEKSTVDNPAYIARARALEKEFELELMTQLEMLDKD